MRCSSDVRSALGVAERYWQVLADATTAVVVELGEEVGFQLTYGFGPAEARRHTADLTIASLVRIVGDLASAPIAPSRIELSYPPNATPERYRAAFGTDRVEDGGRQSALWYRAADTRIPSVAPDAALDEVLQQHLATLSARLPASSTSIRSRVRRVLVRELPAGSLSLDSVAKHLGQSPRTLQRRLAEEDTRWAELVDETRLQLARHHLSNGAVSLGEVAFLLGYRSQAAFTRAFKRWTGTTPAEARDRAIR